MPKANGNCVIGAEVKAKIEVLEENWRETKKTFARMFDELKEIRELLSGRPTWTVLTVVSLLSSLSVGLIVTLFRVLS